MTLCSHSLKVKSDARQKLYYKECAYKQLSVTESYATLKKYVPWISAAIPFKARLEESFEEAYTIFERASSGDHV